MGTKVKKKPKPNKLSCYYQSETERCSQFKEQYILACNKSAIKKHHCRLVESGKLRA